MDGWMDGWMDGLIDWLLSVYFCPDIRRMISNASDTVMKMRDDLRKIADDVSEVHPFHI